LKVYSGGRTEKRPAPDKLREDIEVVPTEPNPAEPHRSPKWVQWLGFTPAPQWSTRRRVVYGLIGVLLVPAVFTTAISGTHPRGPWFGVLAVLVYAAMFGWVIVAPRRYDGWMRRHRGLDAAFFGPLLFLALGFATSLPLLWCAAIALIAPPLVVLLSRRRRDTAGT